MTRRSRAVAAFAAMLAFLFAQAAASAYACAGPVVDPVAMAQMKADMGDEGGLCEKHCGSTTPSLEAAKPSFSATAAITAVPLRIAPIDARPTRIVTRAAPLSVAGPAPPLIRFTVLRI